MIRWLWNQMMKWGWDFNRNLREEVPTIASARKRGRNTIVACDNDDRNLDLPDPISFRVQAVNGGTIIETRWYDPKKDEGRVKLHIINTDQDLSEAIGKIVTMELLQK